MTTSTPSPLPVRPTIAVPGGRAILLAEQVLRGDPATGEIAIQSLERAATTQLRLNHLVEGLSTVAITYYAVSLLAQMGGGLELFGLHVEHDILAAVLTGPVFFALYFYLRRERHRLLGE